MRRKALIIGSPGTDLPGVKQDMSNFQYFFESALGGAWLSSEITTLTDPTTDAVLAAVENLKKVDYSVTIFAGHGNHPKRDGSTVLQLRPGVHLEANRLKTGAAKHTLIVDCCRQLAPEIIMDSAFEALAKSEQPLNAADCRTYFDKAVKDCADGYVAMFACDIGETSNETRHGGFYSLALVADAKDWHRQQIFDTSKSYKTLSVTQAHSLAAKTVKDRTGERQNPISEYPRLEKQFPFAVVA